MSEPEGYYKIGKEFRVYYVDLHKGSSPESRKIVGIGGRSYPEITLEPAEALELLKWLSEHKDDLEQLAKEQEEGKS